MKIPAATPQLIPPQKTSASNPEPSAPFGQLLESGTRPQDVANRRAFAFGELGLFGSARSVTMRSRAPGTPSVPVRLAEPPLDDPPPAIQRIASRPAPFPGPAPTASIGKPSAPLSDPTSAVVASSRGNVSALAVASPPAAAHKPPASAGLQQPGGATSRDLPRPAHTGQVRLSISEENGSAQVVARSPDLGPEARERLRRAVAELAAEFGVTLARFTLNGSTIEPDFVLGKGAPDGDHRG